MHLTLTSTASSQYEDNERLEFLGDAVLELTVSEHLYRLFPDRPEGELTKLRAAIVCEPSLVRFAESLEFGHYVLLGKGEELTGDGRARRCWPTCLSLLSARYTWIGAWKPLLRSFIAMYFPS